jgi:tetratricopeptide (TPR) repeat protein
VADGDALTADALTAPTSLQTLLAARLDALPGDERAAVQNAAVLGQSFTRGALAALTTSDGTDVDAALEGLVRKEILALETDPRSPERGQYRFVQAMVRSVAYETLAKRDRKTRHLLAAAHLAAEPDADSFAAVLASHYLDARAAAPGDDDADELAAKAVELLERAAQRAEGVGSPQQAQRHYLRALEFARDDAAVARLAAAAGKAAVTAGDQAEGVRLAEQATAAFDRLGMLVESARALVTVAEGLNGMGTGSQVPDRLEPVYASLEGVPGAAPVLMRLAMQIARGYFGGHGDAGAGTPWIDRAAALAEGEEDWEALAYSLSGWSAMLMTMGRVTAGLGMLRIALDVAREHEVPSAELAVLNNLASFEAARDITAARGYAEEGLTLVRRLGDYDAGGYLLATASFVYWLAGEWDRLEPLAADARGDTFTTAVQTVYVTLARVSRGEAAPEPPSGEGDPDRSVQLRAAVQSLRAIHAMNEGDTDGAADHATRAVEIYQDFGGLDDDFPTYWCLAIDTSLSAGRLDVAGTWLRRISEAPRGTLSPLMRGLIPYFRARLGVADGGDEALVSADFATAATALEEFGTPYWQGRCLLEHGEWAARQGQDAAARTLIDEAARIFAGLRATPWLARAERARALALR